MGTEAARIHLVHAARDAALAKAIATELTSHGLEVSGDYVSGDHVESADSDGLLVGAVTVAVLCTPTGMRDRALRDRAAAALMYAQHGGVLVPLLLDPGADPTTMFGPHEWLVPASTAPADVAAAVFEEVFGRSSPSTRDQLPHAEDGAWPVIGSPREALRVANRAIAQTTVVRRVLWSAVAAVVVLTAVLAVLVLSSNQTCSASLLLTALPLVAFAAGLASLRPTRRDRSTTR